jgi:hypothetical protein
MALAAPCGMHPLNRSQNVELTAPQLQERSRYRRAVEAVIWGMPAVTFDRMLEAFKSAGGGANQVA